MNRENIDQVFERKSLISASPLRSAAVPFIETATIHFIIEAVDPLILPQYKGSTFRGGFGSALRRISCKTGAEDCRGCGSALSCDYSYIFNTPPPPGSARMKKAEAAPHPFVIEPPLEEKYFYEMGERLSFSLILIGQGIEFLDIFIRAIEEMGDQGIGKKRESSGRFRVKELRSSGNHPFIQKESSSRKSLSKQLLPIFPDPDSFECNDLSKQFSIFFLSPSRFCIENRPVSTRDFDFQILIRHLIRRISLLGYFHGNGDPFQTNINEFIEEASKAKIIRNNLDWFDWERYSSSQDKRMTLGGLIGCIELEGPIQTLIPILKTGEVIHVGKNTTFGLGKYYFKMN
jgi:hypothetical protein